MTCMSSTTKRIAVSAVVLVVLVVSGCGSTVPLTGTPLDGWEQVWLDTDVETQAKMCGTFDGDVPLSSGEVGAEALWEALERDDYVIGLGYDQWYDFMQTRCTSIDNAG